MSNRCWYQVQGTAKQSVVLFPLRAFGAQEAKHVSGTAPLGLQAPHVLSASIQSRARPGGGAGSSPHLVPARMPSTWGAGPWEWGRSRFQSLSPSGAPAQHVERRGLSPALPAFPPWPVAEFLCLYHSSAPDVTSFLQPLLNRSLCVFCPCFLSSG